MRRGQPCRTKGAVDERPVRMSGGDVVRRDYRGARPASSTTFATLFEIYCVYSNQNANFLCFFYNVAPSTVKTPTFKYFSYHITRYGYHFVLISLQLNQSPQHHRKNSKKLAHREKSRKHSKNFVKTPSKNTLQTTEFCI